MASAHNNNNKYKMYSNNYNNSNDDNVNDNVRNVNAMQSTTIQLFTFKANTANKIDNDGRYLQQQNIHTTHVHAHSDGNSGYKEQAEQNDESNASKAAVTTHEHF